MFRSTPCEVTKLEVPLNRGAATGLYRTAAGVTLVFHQRFYHRRWAVSLTETGGPSDFLVRELTEGVSVTGEWLGKPMLCVNGAPEFGRHAREPGLIFTKDYEVFFRGVDAASSCVSDFKLGSLLDDYSSRRLHFYRSWYLVAKQLSQPEVVFMSPSMEPNPPRMSWTLLGPMGL